MTRDDSNEDVALLDKIDSDVLATLISELPDGYRVVLNMYAIEGYSHREIAKVLGIKEGTSSSQYHRAKKELKKKIEQWMKDN